MRNKALRRWAWCQRIDVRLNHWQEKLSIANKHKEINSLHGFCLPVSSPLSSMTGKDWYAVRHCQIQADLEHLYQAALAPLRWRTLVVGMQ